MKEHLKIYVCSYALMTSVLTNITKQCDTGTVCLQYS